MYAVFLYHILEKITDMKMLKFKLKGLHPPALKSHGAYLKLKKVFGHQLFTPRTPRCIYFLSRARAAWCLSFDSMLMCAGERHTVPQGTTGSLWELSLKCLHLPFTQKTVIKHLRVPGLHSACGGNWKCLRWRFSRLVDREDRAAERARSASQPVYLPRAWLSPPTPFPVVRDGNTRPGSWGLTAWPPDTHDCSSQDAPGLFPFLSLPRLDPFWFDFYSIHSTNNAFFSASISAAAPDPADPQALPFLPCLVLTFSL